MYPKQRWISEKIKLRLELIIPLIYIKRKPLPSFRHQESENALTPPQIGLAVDDSQWREVDTYPYWGTWLQNFVLRTTFTIPEDWDTTQPLALHLPLSEAGDFNPPEALAYIDGIRYAAYDRHHQEILLKPESADGKPHLLALHGWTGLGGTTRADLFTKLYDDKMWPADPASSFKESELNVDNDSVQLDLSPYQIMTLRLKPK